MGKKSSETHTVKDPGTGAVTREQFEERLRQFVRHGSGERTVRKNTPLFESGLIDSIRTLDLIILIEEVIGRRVADEEIVLGSFRTIEAICATFLPKTTTSNRAMPGGRLE
jgi:acyl carrier protein